MDLNGLCMTFARPEKLQGNVIFIFYVGNFVIGIQLTYSKLQLSIWHSKQITDQEHYLLYSI